MQLRLFLTGAVALAAVLVLAGVAPAQALTQQEAADQIAERYGVEVLKSEAELVDGKAIILLTVMQGGGNDNAAFQVNTIAVDAKTGEVIPGFRRMETGSLNASGASASTIEDRRPASTRTQPWR